MILAGQRSIRYVVIPRFSIKCSTNHSTYYNTTMQKIKLQLGFDVVYQVPELGGGFEL